MKIYITASFKEGRNKDEIQEGKKDSHEYFLSDWHGDPHFDSESLTRPGIDR